MTEKESKKFDFQKKLIFFDKTIVSESKRIYFIIVCFLGFFHTM